MKDGFETETHAKILNITNSNELEGFREKYSNSHKSFRLFKVEFRFLRKCFSAFFRKTSKNDFKTVLFITLSKPPLDYISAFRKQYPDKDIKVLIPLETKEGLGKSYFDFEFQLQNHINTASLYKLHANKENVIIYGLYSKAFSECDYSRLQYLAPFVKAARYVAKKLKPDIIHSDNIPFFLGAEFDKKSYFPIKVLQIIDDFSVYEKAKEEPFWAAINLVGNQGMKKLCKDKIIAKCIASLFNLYNAKCFYQMDECLEFLYRNYYTLRRYTDKRDDIEENVIFKRLNAQTLKIFPQMICEDDLYYNIMFQTIKRTNFWAVPSKTYYNNLFANPKLSGKLFNRIHKTKNKSTYISYGYKIPDFKIYKHFTVENFRDLRQRNKKHLIREFSRDRIRTNFIDVKFFENKEYIIKGYLDSFYAAPLIFCKFSPEIFAEGADIALTIILKLFEQYKNVQVIINIPDGLKNNRIQSWIEFLEQNSLADGKWLFIDGNINLGQFYASADMTFFPARQNITHSEHYTALRYGCIPIVSRVGIFNDTISDIFDDMTNGCGFKTKPSDKNDELFENFYKTVLKALNLYTNNPASWNLLIKNAMNYNPDWTFEIIERYQRIYNKLV